MILVLGSAVAQEGRLAEALAHAVHQDTEN